MMSKKMYIKKDERKDKANNKQGIHLLLLLLLQSDAIVGPEVRSISLANLDPITCKMLVIKAKKETKNAIWSNLSSYSVIQLRFKVSSSSIAFPYEMLPSQT